ncbi:MAG: hypothetical protein JOY54_18205 [Acidobacteriaceae bacterium]|nr:hypothetical protein [Acidobacteriaceae bacterium]
MATGTQQARASPAAPSGSSVADHFSLVVGGPFYRALVRMHLVQYAGADIGRRVIVLLLLTWAPLLILSLAAGTAFGTSVRIPLLKDFSIYGRFLVGIPLLLLAEIVIDPWIQHVVSKFASSGVVRERDRPAYDALLKKVAQRRDSGLVELIVALVAFFPLFVLGNYVFAGHEWGSHGITSWHSSASGGFSPAGWWFAFVASPVLRFLMFRWLWRYALWSFLLYKVAKLDLALVPIHPDKLGGLSFVLMAQRHFGILFAALGAFIAGQYANSITYLGTSIDATKVPTAVFIVLAVLVVLGPLLLLCPKLIECNRDGIVRYDEVARHLTESFDSAWATESGSKQKSMLGSQDPSSVADFISSYNVVDQMRVVPINKELVLLVAAEAAAPLAVLWIFATPLEEIIRGLMKMLA